MVWMRMRKEHEKVEIEKYENEKDEIEKDENEKDENEKKRKLDYIRKESLSKLSILIVTSFCTKLVRSSPTHISILVYYFHVSGFNSWRQGYATISSIEPCTKILLQRTTLQLQGPML
jgi:hypothetical protein